MGGWVDDSEERVQEALGLNGGVGGWVGWVEEREAVGMRCWRTWAGGRVGGWEEEESGWEGRKEEEVGGWKRKRCWETWVGGWVGGWVGDDVLRGARRLERREGLV